MFFSLRHSRAFRRRPTIIVFSHVYAPWNLAWPGPTEWENRNKVRAPKGSDKVGSHRQYHLGILELLSFIENQKLIT